MHPFLRAILLRHLAVLATLAALMTGAGIYVPGVLETASSLAPQVPEMAPPLLPDPAWQDEIRTALAALSRSPSQEAHSQLESTLISPRTTAGRTATRLTLIVPRGTLPLAMIDGRVYRSGDTLPDGRRVHAISPQGVLLEAAGALDLVPWIPPMAVRLEQAAEAPAFANATLEAPANATNATPAGGVDPQQALHLLRQLETLRRAR